MKITRHQHREWALQVLYSLDLKDQINKKTAQIECEGIKMRNELAEGDKGDHYFQDLVFGVIEDKEELDSFIDDKAIDWKIERMAYIDRNILRIALFEITNELVPTGVAINEAVELAKDYGDDKSSSFINGILAKA